MAEDGPQKKRLREYKNFKEFLTDWKSRPRPSVPQYTGFVNHVKFVKRRDRWPVKEFAFWILGGAVLYAFVQRWTPKEPAKSSEENTSKKSIATATKKPRKASEATEKEFLEFIGVEKEKR